MEYKFEASVAEHVLSGDVDTTWRVDDERTPEPGDTLSLCYEDGDEFAQAEVVWVKETTFGRLTEEDKRGHESYEDMDTLLETFKAFYDEDIRKTTRVRVIKFAVIS